MKSENAVVLVPQGLASEIMKYLSARPYVEVAPIIQALQRCQLAEVRAEPPVSAELGRGGNGSGTPPGAPYGKGLPGAPYGKGSAGPEDFGGSDFP